MDHVQHNYAPRCARLLHDRIVLRFPELPKEHEVAGTGIKLALPDSRYFQRSTRDAVVVAIGPGKYVTRRRRGKPVEVFEPTTLKVGDRVLLDALKTQSIGLFLSEWDGERGDFRVVVESDVDAVLEPDAALEVG